MREDNKFNDDAELLFPLLIEENEKDLTDTDVENDATMEEQVTNVADNKSINTSKCDHKPRRGQK